MYELLGLLWKHLFCRNLCELFAGCGIARCVLVMPHTPFCSRCAPRVGGGEHMPFSCRRAERIFLAAVLGLFAAVLICKWPCLFCPFIFLLLSLLALFLSEASLYLSPLLPLLSSCPTFVLCLSHFLLFHSPEVASLFKMNRSILSIIASLLLGGSDTWSSIVWEVAQLFFLSFSTVLNHSSSCWASSISYSFASPEKHYLCFFLITPLYLVLSAVHPAPPNQFPVLNFALASPSPQWYSVLTIVISNLWILVRLSFWWNSCLTVFAFQVWFKAVSK